MRRYHIERKLRKKFQDWVVTVKDEKLKQDLMDGTIITGGAITSMLLDEVPKDYDLYFRTRDLTRRVAEYYVAKFKECELNVVRYGYTENAVDMRVVVSNGRVMVKVQSAGFAAEGETKGYQYFELIQDPVEREAAIEGFVTAAVKASPKDEEAELPRYRPIFLTSNAIT